MDSLDRRRSRCYDLAKVLTIVMVVVHHAAAFYSPHAAMAPARESAFLGGLAAYVDCINVRLFVLVAGAVWGYCIRHGKYRQNGPFLLGKLRRLGVPYLFFGLCTVAPVVVLCGYTDEPFFRFCLRGILLGYDSRHLWFLLVLLLLFVSTLALKPLVKRDPLWTLPICVALFLIAGHMPLIFKLRTACKYALFFYLGVCVDRYYEPLEAWAKKLRWAIPIPFVLLVGCVLWNPNFITDAAYTLMGLAGALALMMNLTDAESLPQTRVYQILQRDGFGLYLIHAMVIYVLFYFLGGSQIPPLVMFLLALAVSMAVGIGGSELLRRAGLGVLLGE